MKEEAILSSRLCGVFVSVNLSVFPLHMLICSQCGLKHLSADGNIAVDQIWSLFLTSKNSKRLEEGLNYTRENDKDASSVRLNALK